MINEFSASRIAQLDTLIEQYYVYIKLNAGAFTDKEKHAAVAQLAKMNNALRFLQSNPDADFIEKQLIGLQNAVVYREANFEAWKKSEIKPGTLAQLKTRFDKEMEIPKIKSQIEFLSYIISLGADIS
jgi:hypothetical protein